jgi:membrane protein required for colicin V production
MNWVDIAVALIMIFFFIAGVRKGFIQEVMGLIAIILAFILGITGAPIWSEVLVEKLKFPSSVATVVIFILIFILVFILVKALGNILFKVVRATPLDVIDRLGGSLVGLVKGALIISLMLIFLGLFSLPRVIDQELNDSASAVPLRALAPSVYRLFKGIVPQMRSLGDVVGESVEQNLTRSKEKIREKGSQVIDKLQESKSGDEEAPASESSPAPETD